MRTRWAATRSSLARAETERATEAVSEVMREIERASFREVLERLPERYRFVLVRRYGLEERGPTTLAVLSDELKVSRERVRRLQREAEHVLKSRMLTTGGARSYR